LLSAYQKASSGESLLSTIYRAISECDLASDFDLDDPDALTAVIEKTTLAFINRIDKSLSGVAKK
jgi:hypothetical protein